MYGKKATAYLSLIATRLGRGCAQFLLFVLLSNFLTTAALSAQSADLQKAVTDDFQSAGFAAGVQSYVICTPQGLKRITLDENGNPVGDSDRSWEHCVYCLPFHKLAGELISYVADFPVVDTTSYKLAYTPDVLIEPRSILDLSSPPRAPPLA